MNSRSFLVGLALLAVHVSLRAEPESPIFTLRLTNREAVLFATPTGSPLRIETSSNLVEWSGLTTLPGNGSGSITDTAAPFFPLRFYRTRTAAVTNALPGDHLATADGEVTIHPINHATFVMAWKDKMIYCDPVGGAGRFQGLPPPDLILVTHNHQDHFEASTINAVTSSNTVVLAPSVVFQALPSGLKTFSGVLTSGAMTNLLGLTVEAVPAYNSRHPRGAGNGYVVTIGGKRIYLSGDTEDTPEMRALREIDVAFLCMNLPFTMSVDQAASAVREFQPRIVYPYHYSNSNVTQFKRILPLDFP